MERLKTRSRSTIFLIFTLIIITSSILVSCNKKEDTTKEISNSDEYIHGAIGVGFQMNVSEQEAEAVLKKYNLTFTRTDDLNLGRFFFIETGEKFAVKTGEGKEDYWIFILKNESMVYDARWLPDPDKVLLD